MKYVAKLPSLTADCISEIAIGYLRGYVAGDVYKLPLTRQFQLDSARNLRT